jgi:AcrR family transcriptional regulator
MGENTSLRDRILDGAAECLLDFGHKRTTIGDIAARSRVSRATVYNHIGNRTKVTAALMRRELGRLYASIATVLDTQPTANDVIVEGVVLLVRGARDNKLFQRLLKLEPELVLPWLTTRSQYLLEEGACTLAPYLRAGMERGELRRVDPEMAGRWITLNALSLILAPDSSPALRDNNLRSHVHEFIVLGLAAPQAALTATGRVGS